jgi:uncharacterized membrane protein (Fun14 family)
VIDNVGLGIVLGFAIGAAVGSQMAKKKDA